MKDVTVRVALFLFALMALIDVAIMDARVVTLECKAKVQPMPELIFTSGKCK